MNSQHRNTVKRLKEASWSGLAFLVVHSSAFSMMVAAGGWRGGGRGVAERDAC